MPSAVCCCNPVITNLYFSPTVTVLPFIVSSMSSILVNSFWILLFGIVVSGSVSVNFTTISLTLSSNVDLLKYLSDTEKSTVTLLFSLSISVFEYTYVNSGLIESINIVPVLFASMFSASFITISVIVPDVSIALKFWLL